MKNWYTLTNDVKTIFSLLRDDLSRSLFFARLQYDICPSEQAMKGLTTLTTPRPENSRMRMQSFYRGLDQLCNEKRPFLIYGTGGEGLFLYTELEQHGKTVAGFCSRGSERFANGYLGKPVYSPEWLIAHGKEYYVVIAVSEAYGYYTEIRNLLRANHFPEDHILTYLEDYYLNYDISALYNYQYFEFPELFKNGTAFIDAGAYNLRTCYDFANWCNNGYSQIFAFEPDPRNYQRCLKVLDTAYKNTFHNIKVFQSGLSDKNEMLQFHASFDTSSSFLSQDADSGIQEMLQLPTTTIDELMEYGEIGFIKMNIEGFELRALHGAEQVLKRDKPLLAICAYHIPGDVIALMDYCHQVVPEYTFYLRHYLPSRPNETVLYASIE